MPSNREVLAYLTRDELLEVVQRFELAPADRRKTTDLVEAVAGSKKATLAEVLPTFGRERLKELCRALGLDDSGKEKAGIVQRLTGTAAHAPERAAAPTPKSGQQVGLFQSGVEVGVPKATATPAAGPSPSVPPSGPTSARKRGRVRRWRRQRRAGTWASRPPFGRWRASPLPVATDQLVRGFAGIAEGSRQ